MGKIQFSKLLVGLCFLLAIGGIGFVAYISMVSVIDISIAISIITACGTILATTLIFYLKKSQAENTLKIYLSTYKEIINIKKENNEDIDNIIEDVENDMMSKMTSTLDDAIYNATSPIERQDLL